MPTPNAVLRTLALCVFAVTLAACGPAERPAAPGIEDPAAQAPPVDDSEGIVEATTPEGTAAAELVVEPAEIEPGGEATVTVSNRGDVELGYGRAIEVERWDGEAWSGWEPAEQAVWTEELLVLPPGEAGEDQTFPFTEERPEPGWYRLTKRIFVHGADGGEPTELTVRARVRVG